MSNRDRLIRFTVRYVVGNCRLTEGEYHVKFCGKPNDAGLAEHITDLLASVAPGGCNAHVGPLDILSATLHDNKNGVVLGQWTKG